MKYQKIRGTSLIWADFNKSLRVRGKEKTPQAL